MTTDLKRGTQLRCPVCGNGMKVTIALAYPPVCNNPSHKPQAMEEERNDDDQ